MRGQEGKIKYVMNGNSGSLNVVKSYTEFMYINIRGIIQAKKENDKDQN